MEGQRLEREARGGAGGSGADAPGGGNKGRDQGADGSGGKDGSGGSEKKRVEVGLIDLDLVKSDIGKLNPLVYHYLKVSSESRSPHLSEIMHWSVWADRYRRML